MNPFIQSGNFAVESIKSIKEEYTANQLRGREVEFSFFKQLKVFAGSWNLNGQVSDKSLSSWLACPDADLYALGFQELDLETQAYLMTDASKETAICNEIEASLKDQGGQYLRVASKKLVGIYLVVYVKREHYASISNVTTEYVTTGLLGVMGNKGAVAVRFKMFDSFLTFVDCHMAGKFVSF
jgi:inositol polyphosphate 5-phosphatase INPP5B/F